MPPIQLVVVEAAARQQQRQQQLLLPLLQTVRHRHYRVEAFQVAADADVDVAAVELLAAAAAWLLQGGGIDY